MSTAEIAALRAQLTRLTEQQAAANILHAFAAALDEPDVDTVLRLFREDAVLVSPRRTATGHDEIRSFFREAWAADPSQKRHFVAAPRVTWLEPGRVRLEAYFTFIGRAPDRSVLGWGTYDDIVDVTGNQPRFARVEMRLHHHTDLTTGWATGPSPDGEAQRSREMAQ